jgi:hypothetical protein
MESLRIPEPKIVTETPKEATRRGDR